MKKAAAAWLVMTLATLRLPRRHRRGLVLYKGQSKDPILIPLFKNKFYFDELYAALIAGTQDLLADALRASSIKWLIDGLLVRGLSGAAWATGFALRFLQFGNLQAYAFLFGFGRVALIYLLVFRLRCSTCIIFIPLLAALGILLGAPARKTALGAAIAQFALTLLAFLSYDRGEGRLPVPLHSPIVPDWKLNYSVGADGLSLVMLLLTGIVTLAAVWVTPKIEKRENLFYACLLFISAGAAGAFASHGSLLLLRLPRARAHPDLPAHRPLGHAANATRPRGKSPSTSGSAASSC